MSGEITLTATLHRPAYQAMPTPQQAYLLLKATPTAAASGKGSQPVNFSLVVDRSGSMAGEKLRHLKAAAKLIVHCLVPAVKILPTATLPPIVPTNTPVKTLAPTSSPAPSRRTTSTPTPEPVIQAGLGIWPLVAMACVVAFGFLGLGGIGLLGVVIRRSQQRPSPTPGRPLTSHRCPRCGAYHRYQAQFCPSCGYQLDQYTRAEQRPAGCTNCGHQLRAESKFCPRCGTRQ